MLVEIVAIFDIVKVVGIVKLFAYTPMIYKLTNNYP